MEISGISASLVSSISNNSTRTGDAVTISTLKKALDTQAQTAATMIQGAIESIPQPDPSSPIGQNLNVKA